jgi:hypothetical protein
MTHEDNHSLLAWLRGKELEAHNEAASCNVWVLVQVLEAREKAFREVITHIENNPKELHRCLIPAGWEEVDG